MPFTGPTFSYTAGTSPGPSGTAISSTKTAQRDTDVENALNTTQSVARGGTGATTVITAHDALVTKGADIASAGTINLTTATGASVAVTGTTTITTVTLASGMRREVTCSAALPITASASLVVDGTVTGTTTFTAGDVLLFQGEAALVRVSRIGNSSKAYRRDNIIGTVSQVGGIPTGAIIETGSNANGEYTKYADGTLICWFRSGLLPAASTAVGSGFQGSATLSWTFPVAFSATPVVSAAGEYSSVGRGWVAASAAPSTTAAAFIAYSFVSGSLNYSHLHANGRWF